MNDFPGPEKFKGFSYLRVFNNSDQVVIGGPGFLFCRQVLMEICYGIALGLEFTGIKGNARSSRWPQGCGMVDIISVKARCLGLFRCQIFGQLIDNGADHFQMGKLFCANICQQSAHFLAWHGVTLGKITHGSS